MKIIFMYNLLQFININIYVRRLELTERNYLKLLLGIFKLLTNINFSQQSITIYNGNYDFYFPYNSL